MDNRKAQAVIDLGSHSALLLIGRKDEQGRLLPMVQDFAVTRLAEDLPFSGKIGEGAMTVLMSVLERFHRKAEEQRVGHVQVLATEALRRAQNSAQVAALIGARFGWPLRILRPEEEARLAYRGSLTDAPVAGQKRLVVDVGGGSTEVIAGQGRRVVHVASAPIGALNLAQKFKRQEQLSDSDRLGLMRYLEHTFSEIPFWTTIDERYVLIGSGGTATTLAALQLGLKNYDVQSVNRCALSRRHIWRWFYQLNKLSLLKRRQLNGLESGREDVILYGTLILLTLMESRGFDLLHVRQGGVRYGWLLEMFG